jgi:hypothetical protein
LLPAGYTMVNEEDTPALLAELLLVRILAVIQTCFSSSITA